MIKLTELRSFIVSAFYEGHEEPRFCECPIRERYLHADDGFSCTSCQKPLEPCECKPSPPNKLRSNEPDRSAPHMKWGPRLLTHKGRWCCAGCGQPLAFVGSNADLDAAALEDCRPAVDCSMRMRFTEAKCQRLIQHRRWHCEPLALAFGPCR